MISMDRITKILNTLAGVSNTSISTPKAVYLGLCSGKPTSEGVISGEPVVEGNGYARKKISGTDANTLEKYFNATSTYKISNNKEIQFKTARKDFPAKINYWFLSESLEGGSAYAWGLIKKTILDEITVESTTSTFVLEDAINLEIGQTYIVSYDNKEYEVQTYIRDERDIQFMISGDNPLHFILDGDDQKTVILETTTDKDFHTIEIYEKGIEVKKSTVVTFYENDLEISLNEDSFE